ncbi:nuclear transport factor 2 family protein [Streptomyces sp. NPDC006879]|uniref:nuclear transport factor 2 family protein n=1 Tax=Streptomyces sp. NPDC006879 TaxID=3364767 RepID=UPI0036882F36
MTEHPDYALVHRGYEAFTAGDLDTLAALMTADVIHHVPGSSKLSGHHKGREAVMDYYRSLMEETGGTLAVELRSVFVDGRGHAMSVHTIRADRGDRGIEMGGGLFFTIVGGKITDIDECVADIEESDAFWS